MMNNLTPVVKNLLILNIGVFLIQMISNDFITNYGMLYNPEMSQFQPYQFFTYMFLHAGLGHIFFNMLWLFFMGSKLEMFMGEKKFISLYLIAGLGAALFHFLVNKFLFMDPPWALLGASGAVAGIMMGAALYFPNDEVIIFPLPIPIKIKYLVIFYTVFEIYKGLTANDGVAHFAHVGGLLFGFLYIKIFSNNSSGFRY